MIRVLGLIVVAAICFGCTPKHSVKPLPNFVSTAIQVGDKVVVTTKAGETIKFVVSEVTDKALIGDNRRFEFADIAELKIVSWERPRSPCGGDKSLGCSVPLLVSIASDVHAHYGRHFHDACAQHDYCYRHGSKTYGLDRDDCDKEFLENMLKSCPRESGSRIGRLLQSISDEPSSRKVCLLTADEFHAVVRRFGEKKFLTDASTYCEYNGPPVSADTSQ